MVLALTWMLTALGVTVLFAPRLGLRGLAWLTVHDALCAVGCSHELWRGWKRRRAVAVPSPKAG